jgi:hypothetical protein
MGVEGATSTGCLTSVLERLFFSTALEEFGFFMSRRLLTSQLFSKDPNSEETTPPTLWDKLTTSMTCCVINLKLRLIPIASVHSAVLPSQRSCTSICLALKDDSSTINGLN